MKQLWLCSLLCFLLFNVEAQNDSIRLLIFPFEIDDTKVDPTLAIKIPKRIQGELIKDFLFINTDDAYSLEIKSYIYNNEPEIEPSDIDIASILKKRVPNYYITGSIDRNELIIAISEYPTNKPVDIIDVSWKLDSDGYYDSKKVKKAADEIWRTLVGASVEIPSAMLEIRSKHPSVDISFANNSLSIVDGRASVPVERGGDIGIFVNGQRRKILLEDNFINRFKIKRKGSQYEIKRSIIDAQLSGWINSFDDHFVYSSDLSLKFLMKAGFSVGGLFQYYYNLTHSYDYPTLDGLPSIRQTQTTELFNFALLGSYERYLPTMHIIWDTNVYAMVLPETGFGGRTGLAYEEFPFLFLKIGYQWFQADVEQAVFNPFGDADFEEVQRVFKGFYLGLSWQRYF